jgi:hypothetical protein
MLSMIALGMFPIRLGHANTNKVKSEEPELPKEKEKKKRSPKKL